MGGSLLRFLLAACLWATGGRITWMRGLPLLFVCLMSLSACGADVDILTLSNEGDANEVMATLLNQGITPSRTSTKAGIVITVPGSALGHALEVLREAGLPRERFEGLGKTFQKEGMISSPIEERALYVYALSQELANTLSKIDGVVVARVHVVLPEPAGVDRVATPAKAGVFIKYHADQPLDAVLPQLRTMVTHAIPGLTADNVSIALIPAATSREFVPPPPVKHILGVAVALTPDSIAQLKLLIAGLAGVSLIAVGAGGMCWWHRGRRKKPPRRGAGAAQGALLSTDNQDEGLRS